MGASSWERHLRQLGLRAPDETPHTAALFLANPAQGQVHGRLSNPDPTPASKRSNWEHRVELSTQNLGDQGFDPLNWRVMIAFLS